jgi:hypothetical protein
MAKFKGRSVKLNKPFRTPSGSKKFGVYVKNRRTNRVQIVRFGAKGMSIKKNIPSRQRSFMARFRPILAKVRGQKTLSPAYWAIQSWKKGFKI